MRSHLVVSSTATDALQADDRPPPDTNGSWRLFACRLLTFRYQAVPATLGPVHVGLLQFFVLASTRRAT
jgi:hypothetical protein